MKSNIPWNFSFKHYFIKINFTLNKYFWNAQALSENINKKHIMHDYDTFLSHCTKPLLVALQSTISGALKSMLSC